MEQICVNFSLPNSLWARSRCWPSAKNRFSRTWKTAIGGKVTPSFKASL